MTSRENTSASSSEMSDKEPGRLGRFMMGLFELLANSAVGYGTRSENVYGRDKAHDIWPHPRRTSDVGSHQAIDQSHN